MCIRDRSHAKNKFVKASNQGSEPNAERFSEILKEFFMRERKYEMCIRDSTFVRILVRSPSVSAVHAGGLSVLQLKGIVVKTFTECPLHLRSLDRS